MRTISKGSHTLPTSFSRLYASEIKTIMRNEKNIARNVRDKNAITCLLLKYIYLSVTSSFIKGSKKTQKKKFIFLTND